MVMVDMADSGYFVLAGHDGDQWSWILGVGLSEQFENWGARNEPTDENMISRLNGHFVTFYLNSRHTEYYSLYPNPIESFVYFPFLAWNKPSHESEAAAVLEDLDAFRQSLEEQDMVLTGLDSAWFFCCRRRYCRSQIEGTVRLLFATATLRSFFPSWLFMILVILMVLIILVILTILTILI